MLPVQQLRAYNRENRTLRISKLSKKAFRCLEQEQKQLCPRKKIIKGHECLYLLRKSGIKTSCMRKLTSRQLPCDNQRLYWRFLKAIFSSCFSYVLQKLYKRQDFLQRCKRIRNNVEFSKCSLHWEPLADAAPCRTGLHLQASSIISHFPCGFFMWDDDLSLGSRTEWQKNYIACLKLHLWKRNIF